MKRTFFGRSCLLILLGGAGMLLVLFVASVIFNQSQASTPKTAGTLPAAATTAAASSTAAMAAPATEVVPAMGVTIEAGPTAAQTSPTNDSSIAPQASSVVVSVTPGLAPLGTLSYPLTVTAEAYAAATRITRFLNSVDATRTANAEEADIAHMTLTAAASNQ